MIRELEDAEEKFLIARQAIQLVHDEDVVFLDASTSACCMVPLLAEKKGITVITNGIRTITKCSECHIRTIAIGGDVVNSCYAMVGEAACAAIDGYHAHICFFSCRSMSENGVLTDIAEKENYVRRHMIAHASRSYLLLTQSKIGHIHFHTLCHAQDLTGIVTAGKPPMTFSQWCDRQDRED